MTFVDSCTWFFFFYLQADRLSEGFMHKWDICIVKNISPKYFMCKHQNRRVEN